MNTLINKIKKRNIKIGIIGLGYVGLPLVREFLKKKFKVFGFDIDKNKIKLLNKGESYIKHIENSFIKYYINNKLFYPTTDFSLIKEVDAILICVPTPLDKHYNPDLSYVINTTKTIAKYLRKFHIIVLESTTYPGTTEEVLLPILKSSKLEVGKDFFLGYSPEREDPGNTKYSTSNIPKIVSGITPQCLSLIDCIYSQIIEKTIKVSSTKIAEASKILENTYRAVNIALVNELKIIFDKMDINIWEVIEAAKTKPFGFQAFYPGPGLGGHCIPIDPFYLTWKAKEYDIHTKFIELAGEVNTYMPYFIVKKAIKALSFNNKSIYNAKVLLIGVAYKPNIDDIRESPALKIINILEKEEKALVDYYDPYVPLLKSFRYKIKKESIKLEENKLKNYDIVIILTFHSNIDYDFILKNSSLIIDTRNVYNIKGLKNGKIWKA